MKLERATIRGSYAGPNVEIPIAELGDATLVAVTGDNGAGKTTALEAAAPGAIYLRSPSRGQLYDVIRERDGIIEAVWSVNGETFHHRIMVDVGTIGVLAHIDIGDGIFKIKVQLFPFREINHIRNRI